MQQIILRSLYIFTLICTNCTSSPTPQSPTVIDSTATQTSSTAFSITKQDTIATTHNWGKEEHISLGELIIKDTLYKVIALRKWILTANGTKGKALLYFNSDKAIYCYNLKSLENPIVGISENALVIELPDGNHCAETINDLSTLLCCDCLQGECFLQENQN